MLGTVALACGGRPSCALHKDGRVVSWGDSYRNQTDDLPTDAGYVAIAAGIDHFVALRSDGCVVT